VTALSWSFVVEMELFGTIPAIRALSTNACCGAVSAYWAVSDRTDERLYNTEVNGILGVSSASLPTCRLIQYGRFAEIPESNWSSTVWNNPRRVLNVCCCEPMGLPPLAA
jgi:hypothetical protein